MEKKIKYFLNGFSIFLNLLAGYIFAITALIIAAISNGYIAVLYFVLGFIIGLFVTLDIYDLGKENYKKTDHTQSRKFFQK